MADLISQERVAQPGGGTVLVLTFQRPERLNALPDLTDGDEVAAICEAVNADLDIRCVVLTGAGRAFSAGGDLNAMKARGDMFAGSGAAIRRRHQRRCAHSRQ